MLYHERRGRTLSNMNNGRNKASLKTGINLVEENEAIQPLVSQRLQYNSGKCIWIDSKNNASTRFMSRQGLDSRIHVARAFTAHQHSTLVNKTESKIDEDTAVLVLPSINYFYQKPSLPDYDKEKLLSRMLKTISRLAEELEIPVVISKEEACVENREIGWMIESVTDQKIEVEETQLGKHVQTPGSRPKKHKIRRNHFQTTFMYWQPEEVIQVGTN